MRTRNKLLYSLGLLSLSLLASCGGGGGGDDTTVQPLLSFSPSTVNVTTVEGTPATVAVRATVVNDTLLASNTAYVYVVDSQGVLSGNANVVQSGGNVFTATLSTASTLARGRHQGSFQVQVCRDAQCASPFAGSPMALPYDILVNSAPVVTEPTTPTTPTIPTTPTQPTTAPLLVGAVSPPQATAQSGQATPASVTVAVTGAGLVWTAATSASWLRIDGGAGTGSTTFSVSFLPAGLAQGAYADKVTVHTQDGQSAEVPFTLQVLAP